jgi:hypothetical protein
MSAYATLQWLDRYIEGLRTNGQDVPWQLHEVRKYLNDLTYFDGHC